MPLNFSTAERFSPPIRLTVPFALDPLSVLIVGVLPFSPGRILMIPEESCY